MSKPNPRYFGRWRPRGGWQSATLDCVEVDEQGYRYVHRNGQKSVWIGSWNTSHVRDSIESGDWVAVPHIPT